VSAGVVVLGFGPQQLDFFKRVEKMCGKGAIVDPDVARMAGANLAAGAPEALAALRERLLAGALQEAAKTGASPAATWWLASGDRGTSSETMFSHLTGIDALRDSRQSPPYDPSDFSRCRLLLEQVPELVPLFPKMAEVSPPWAELVRQWGLICGVMDAESPDWREGKGLAPQTYKLIQQAIGR